MFINKAVGCAGLRSAEYFVRHSMTSTKMAATARRLSDRDVEYLIVLFQNETPLWDSSSVSYSNADARKAFLRRMSESLGGLDIGK